MSIWEVLIAVVLIIASLVIIAVILLQQGRQANIGAIRGAADSFMDKGRAKTWDQFMAKFTKFIAIAFFVLVLVGMILTNLLTGAVVLDIVCGAAATLVGALGTRVLRRRPLLCLLPPVLANALIVPWVLRYGYGAPDAVWFMALTVGLGELIAVAGLGSALRSALARHLPSLGG